MAPYLVCKAINQCSNAGMNARAQRQLRRRLQPSPEVHQHQPPCREQANQMNQTNRQILMSNLVSHHAMQCLAMEEGLDPSSTSDTVDVWMRRKDEVIRFTELALPLLERIDQPGLDSVVAERLSLEALAAAWLQFKQSAT